MNVLEMQEQEILTAELPEPMFYVDKSPIHGKGLFARALIEEESYIGTYEGPEVTYEGVYVLWVYEEDGSMTARDGRNLLRYLNHSRHSNAYFDGFDLYATRTIYPGEEITFNYNGEGEDDDSNLEFEDD
jgi:SET domain-containing protein